MGVDNDYRDVQLYIMYIWHTGGMIYTDTVLDVNLITRNVSIIVYQFIT